MSYRYGDRDQMNTFPQRIEDDVAKDKPVRADDAFRKVELQGTWDKPRYG